MKIKLQSGDFKLVEELDQLTANTRAYAGQGKASLADAITAPHGVPAAGQYTVDVSYDARMINSQDINCRLFSNSALTSDTTMINCDPPLPGSITSASTPLHMIVPLGYILVIKQISNFVIQGVYSYFNTLRYTDFYVSASLDVKINNASIKTGNIKLSTGESVNTWILADEGQTIKINAGSVKYPAILNNTIDWSTYYYVDIYAHMIEKSRASQLVITNESDTTIHKAKIAGKING